MKCPYCQREVKWPHLQGDIPAVTPSATGRCPHCAGRITYAFSGKKMALASIPAAVVCWLFTPYIGGHVVFVFFVLVLLPAVRLDKHY